MKNERTIVWTCLALALGASVAFGATNEVVVDDGALARTIAAAIARGEREVKIPKATYRLKGNAGIFFEWKAVRDFTVDFSGAHLIALKPYRMFSLVGCTNVTVKNVSFDYDPLPFVQAVIEKVDANGDWDLKVIDGYPDPADCGDTWPMQVFDPVNFEMKNPMRCWDGFRLVKTAPMRYRVSGGRDKRGAVGDICVWSTKHGSVNLHDPQSFTVLLHRCTRCRMEGVTAYSAPNLFCFNEVRGEGNQFVRCTLDRCPPERDYVTRGLKRLRSGNHDGFNSRLAKKAALLDGCTIRYQCDDCVNVSGHFAYVAGVSGAEVRVFDKVTSWGFGAPIEAGDVLQVMTAEGRVRPSVKVTAVRPADAPRPDELAFMKTLGLWPGQESAFKNAYVLTVEGPNPIEKTDVVVSENARGNGFVIRNCTFGPNRALGMRIRGGEGVIESNTVSRVEGAALMMGPEYEWFEGGVFDRVTVRGNLFGGCGGSFNVGGTAAHHRPLPPKAHPSSAFVDNRITGCGNVIRIAGCEEGEVRGNVDLKKPAFRGAMLPHVKIVEDDFRTLRDWGANLVRYQMTENFFRHGEMKGGEAAYDRWLDGQLDRLARDILPWARKYGLKVVVDLHIPPGGRVEGSSMDWAVYYDRTLADHLIACWRKIATRFKGNDDVIYGYDILNEPVQSKPATALDWWELQRQAAKAIRETDAKTPVIVESLDWDSPEAFAEMKPMTDVGPVIYQAHMYRPQLFTHQGMGNNRIGETKWPDLARGWNREFVRERLQAVREFERRTGAKIYIGEFSAAIWAPGAENYITDCIAVFAEYGWDWTYHAFREYAGWSVEHEGTDPQHIRPSQGNPRRDVLKAGLNASAFGEVCWDDAVVIGQTNGEKCFYKAGEEMVFTLTLRGVRGELPANTYFYDWVRTANDGKVEKGRAPVEKPLVVKTKLDIPGFVKLEANVVDRSGRRVPKKHMWEKRVFFQGGAGVDVDKLQAWPEPKDFDAYWARERKVIDDLPLEVVERTPIPCQNEKLNLWRMKIKAPAGVLPATGYLVIPKRATTANRMKATGRLSGYYNFPERCPSWLTNHCDGIEMYVNRHGCEVDQPEEYYKQFYKPVPYPPVHFRDMAYRAMLMFRYLKTLPEWNGKDLIAAGSSGGGMQTFWMGMLEPQLSFIDSTSAALADVFGFKYGRETGHLGERVEGINYFDICNAAKRVKCPVVMNAGIGDYTCPPMGLAIVYNNLRCQKQITWSQGCTHGWWPQGMKRETFSSGPVVEAKAGVEELTVGGRGKDSADPLGELMKTRTLPSNEELARLVAEDLKRPVRPGGVNGQPFWNVSSMQFMYPPAFDFKPVPGAVKYRFTVIDDWLNAQTMEAAQPTAALVEVWPKLRTGLTSVICDGVDASGRLCGRAGGPRRFWKAAPFRPGAYKPAARPYAETAARACEHIWKLRNTQDLLTKGEPDPTYDLNCYPAKMNAGMIRMMLRYARLRPDRAADAIKVARAAADWLIGVSQPAGSPLEYFPPTYRGDKNTAKQYAGQQMLIYPAQAACAYLDLYAAVNDRKYFEAAERIGRTFLKLQGADGAWSLKLWEKDGKPVVPNRCFPLHQVGLLERLYALTKDPVWRAAGDRAFAYVEKGPLATWNWEAQFEDVQPHPPYRALTKHDACSTAIYLVKRFPGDAKRLAQARELLRFSEDQFIYWEKPCRADGTGYRDHTTAPKNLLGWTSDYLRWFTPGVGEQYGWEMPIDASAAKLIRTYLALYEASGNPLDLAKARALGDAMTNIQKEDGSIRTQWLMRPDADNFWINCLGASIEALEMLR